MDQRSFGEQEEQKQNHIDRNGTGRSAAELQKGINLETRKLEGQWKVVKWYWVTLRKRYNVAASENVVLWGKGQADIETMEE